MATSRRSVRRGGNATELAAAASVYQSSAVLAPSHEGSSEAGFAGGRGYALAKRGLDIAVALLGLLLTLPVIAAIAVLIRLDSEGPVFFRQERLGKDTKTFTMLKFRTMLVNSDSL